MKPHTLAKEDKNIFFKKFNELYEHSSWIIEKAFEIVKEDKKYDDLEEFHNLLSQIVLKSSEDLQNKLIKAHPMLAGKKAKAKELTDFSTKEQSSARLNSCSDEEILIFDTLNEKYLNKFGFPFIMAIKAKEKEEILESFRKRINNSFESERQEALKQINKIGWIRIKDIYGK